MNHSSSENAVLIRIVMATCVAVTLLAIGYLLLGEELTRYVYQGGTMGGLFPARHDDGRTLEQYGTETAARFWQNVILGPLLSVVVIILLYKLYKALLRHAADNSIARAASQPCVVAGAPLGERSEKQFFPLRYGLLAVLGIYTVTTLIYFFPTLSTFSQALIGPPEDNMACFWTLSWAHNHFFNGNASLWQINDVFYPEGSSFYLHAWSYYNLYLFHLLRTFFDAVTSYNLLILHSFPLAGLGGFLLVRYFVKNDWLALLGGFLFAFNPAHTIRAIHHMNIATIQFVPFFVLFYVRAIRSESRWYIVGAIAFLLLNALVDWNYLLYGIWFIVLSYGYLALRNRRRWLFRPAAISTIVIVGTIAILSPLLFRMITTIMSGPTADTVGHNIYVVDLAGLIIPNPLHMLGNLGFLQEINHQFSSSPWEGTGYLGVASLLIVAYHFRVLWRRAAAFLLGGLSFLLLAFGAQPHILGARVPALMPGKIVALAPFLSMSRAPARNMVFVYLFWSAIVSLAVGLVWDKIRTRSVRIAVTAGVCLLLVLDYFAVISDTTPVSLPACYSVLPRDGSACGVLDLPSGYVPTERYMMYQSLHGLPIVQGMVSHKPNKSLIDHLEMINLDAQKRQLTESRVRYVILHKEYLPSPTIDTSAYRATYRATYEDDSSVVYQVY